MDRDGDTAKQPPECKINGKSTDCPHLRCTYEGWEGETYDCERCGEHFKLYYDDMR